MQAGFFPAAVETKNGNKNGLPGKTGILHEISLSYPPKIRDVFLLLCLA
jgi:hypothetical protein